MEEWSYDSTHSSRRDSIQVSGIPHSHDRFTLGDRCTHRVGSWVGPRAGQYSGKTKNILPPAADRTTIPLPCRS